MVNPLNSFMETRGADDVWLIKVGEAPRLHGNRPVDGVPLLTDC